MGAEGGAVGGRSAYRRWKPGAYSWCWRWGLVPRISSSFLPVPSLNMRQFCNGLDRWCHFHTRLGWHLDWLRVEIPLSLKPSATCFSTFSSLLILDPPLGRLPIAALLVVLMSASCLVWVARQIAWSFASRCARRCSHQLCTVITSRVS